MRRIAFMLGLHLAGLLPCGCGRSEDAPSVQAVYTEAAPLPFTDVTRQSGIRFEHSFGDATMDTIVESAGGGVTLLDYDGDRRLDIYFVNGAYDPVVNRGAPPSTPHRNRLFRNLGGFRFEDVTKAAGVGDPGYGMGACAGDYDNDGDADLYVANYGRNVLFRNEGNGTFRDVTREAGVGDTNWTVPVLFADFDGDGRLDIYSGNYLAYDPEVPATDPRVPFPSPLAYKGQADCLFRNLGNGHFDEVSKAAGLADPDCHSMGAAAADLDGDGRIDLFVSGDGMANRCFRNLGGMRFLEIASRAGVALGYDGSERASMGVEILDLDADGRLDLLVPDFRAGAAYVADRRGGFLDLATPLGIGAACEKSVTWSGVAFDADMDGFFDLLFTNGSAFFLLGETDRILRGGADKKFRDVSDRSGRYFQETFVGRGLAVGDLDGDGDVDAVVAVLGGRPRLLRNDADNAHHWLAVRLRGTRSNRDGIGARIELRTENRAQIRARKTSAGYLSQNGPLIHFGLGERDRASLRIVWPSGRVQQFETSSVDRVVEIVEPKN